MKNIKRYMYILFLLSLFISFVFTFLFYNATQKVEKISTENIELFNPRNTKISYNYNIEKIETIENKLFIKLFAISVLMVVLIVIAALFGLYSIL